AGLDPAAFVVWVVAAERPAGATPVAYLQPDGLVRHDTVAVFRAVGGERASRYERVAHRLAMWGELPGIPPAALGPMLRHELERPRRRRRLRPTADGARGERGGRGVRTAHAVRRRARGARRGSGAW